MCSLGALVILLVLSCSVSYQGGGLWHMPVSEATSFQQIPFEPNYRKNPKNLDAEKFALITLKVEQGGFTVE